MIVETKFISGNFKYPVKLEYIGTRIYVHFGFNRGLINAIKLLEGPKYHGYDKEDPRKIWSIADSEGNAFRIQRLEGKNPYAHYDLPLLDYIPSRDNLYLHQIEIVKHIITRRYCIVAGEPAVGKTLAVIEAMEWLFKNRNIRSWFYVAPKSALISVRAEFELWKSFIQPQFFTYEGLKSVIENWPKDSPPPMGVIYDEAQKCKTPTSQRTQAAQHLADAIRKEHKDKGVVVELTGTPAPKNPLDWWSLIELARPGFLLEGSLKAFQNRLAIISVQQSDSGQSYPKLETWRDDEKKCNVCGKYAEDQSHNEINRIEKWWHQFTPSVNEVANIYKRCKGLVTVHLKKTCLNLPDKIFKEIICKPSSSILNAAKLIVARGANALQTAIWLRELSDGFQYEQEPVGTETCPICEGSKFTIGYQYIGPESDREQHQESGESSYFEEITKACGFCNGTGQSTKYKREVVSVACPKDDAIIELLEMYEDWGRFVIYAGFTGSIDRCVATVLNQKWDYIRIDGRGWQSNLSGSVDELYSKFRNRNDTTRLAIIAHPASGGVGLNLQAACAEVFYSNDTKGESRQQAIERIHRPGMDENRGATIYDLIHLPSDKLILDSHNKKKQLQDLSLGQFKACLES